MAATRVAVDTPLVWTVGKSTMKLQEILNTLAPGLIPLVVTLLIWRLVSKKVSPTWIILGVFILGIAFSYLNILGIVTK
jgi:PTS system mannose-specific IID component